MQKNDAPYSKVLKTLLSIPPLLLTFSLLLLTWTCSLKPKEEIELLKYKNKEWKIYSANVNGTTYNFGIEQYLLDNVGYIPYFIVQDQNTLIQKNEYKNGTRTTTSYKIIEFTPSTIKTEFRTNLSSTEYYAGVQVISYSFQDGITPTWTINTLVVYATNNISKQAVENYYVNGKSDVKQVILVIR